MMPVSTIPNKNVGVPRPGHCRGQLQHVRKVATSAATVERGAQEAPRIVAVPEELVDSFASLSSVKERLERLVTLGNSLPRMDEEDKVLRNQVIGCTSQVWMLVALNADGTVSVAADSDSEVSRGLASVLIQAFAGLTPSQIDSADVSVLEQLQLGPVLNSPSRNNSFRNMFNTLKKRANALAGNLPEEFPSLVIRRNSLEPQGAFAEAQAQFLQPDSETVSRLASLLQEKSIGVVAHFYMDPEVQGALSSAADSWPHIHISDSLVMADRAASMAEAGCTSICVLGVDFMSENVRAMLDAAGHTDVAVYRMDPADIGCTLAEAAESDNYLKWLEGSTDVAERNLHVVYINTSLRTKAEAQHRVPTITCTSSNVVNTVLQAFSQLPDLNVWYGPDTYMGKNLQELFTSLATMPDEEVAAVHPSHTAASIAQCVPRLHAYPEGMCVVHHIFGGETADAVRRGYADAYITAHFEVPGEMFGVAMEAQRQRGMGVVGSTSNILGFIAEKVQAAQQRGFEDKLQFVLGTETGMITSIVRKVQQILSEGPDVGLDVEIVFPVAPDAITTEQTSGSSSSGANTPAQVELPGGLAVVPGPAGGEGCSSEGGCAACPYMKMNSLAALERVCGMIGSDAAEAMLAAYKPKAHQDKIGESTMVELGCEPILHMRAFQNSGNLPDNLVADIKTRQSAQTASESLP